MEEEEEDKSANEEPRTPGFWESWYIQLQMWLCGGAILVVLYIFGYLTGCDVVSVFL